MIGRQAFPLKIVPFQRQKLLNFSNILRVSYELNSIQTFQV